MTQAYTLMCVQQSKKAKDQGSFLITLKRRKSYFFSSKGGSVNQHGSIPNTPGKWVLPGGKKDAGDHSLVKAAIREFHEETGIDFSDSEGKAFQPPSIKQSKKPYGVAVFDLQSLTGLNKLAKEINAHLEEADKVRQAIIAGKITQYAEIATHYPNCPQDDELERVEVWNVQDDEQWKTIASWKEEDEVDWFYWVIYNELGKALGRK